MTSREIVRKAVLFQSPERMPYNLAPEYGSDFYFAGISPSPDDRPSSGTDEWGAVWENIGVCKLGEVKEYPIKEWTDLDKIKIPDVEDEKRWRCLEGIREKAGDKFLLGTGISLYERVHFIRGLENTWAGIYEDPGKLCNLIDVLVDMNLKMIPRFASLGFDGYMFCDDWGLQNRLMISPESWREIWKPRYTRVYQAARKHGLLTFLHSCGYIVDILDDLIEAGLQVVHMDQQQNMGLEMLGKRFGGRLTFFAPVDIQNTMNRGTPDEIRAYCHKMVENLSQRPRGGFIACWYSDPKGAGHRPEAIAAMCEEFLKISKEWNKK